MRVTGTIEEAYDPHPEKNTYSHVADATQYAALYIFRETGLTPDDSKLVRSIQRRRSGMRTLM